MYAYPQNVPRFGPAIVGWLLEQLRALSNESREPVVDGLVLKQLNAPPAKLFTGLTVLADGANWNPGAGAGVYTYYGGAWNRLG